MNLTTAVLSHTLFSKHDIYLFREGTHGRLYGHFGAHVTEKAGQSGFQFCVWAPNAERVSVIGDFNGWQVEHHVLH
ncbi:MAG: 1,4-alpha-glucan branching protein GlgB, partial [Proteobacteria bacterium]|nr:1,4-alpha-glucan branching protein GlgB [Pseudomonadota bacterium]